MRSDYCEIVTILDRSGSMQGIAKDMEGGFNRFIAEQKLVPGKCKVSLYQFDDAYDVVYEGRDLADVPPCSLEARGSTALLDAVGRTINAVGARLSAMPEGERPGKVVVLIITDGCENASREFNAPRVKAMVEHQQAKYKWQFVYLGSSLSTFADAAEIGVRPGSTYSYAGSGVGAQNMFSTVARSNSEYRAGGRGTGQMAWEASVAAVAPEVVGGVIPEHAPQAPVVGTIVPADPADKA